MAFEQLAETIATTGVVATTVAALGLAAFAFAAAIDWIRWLRRGHCSSRPPEVLFVGRWTDHGPELFLVSPAGAQIEGSSAARRTSFPRRTCSGGLALLPPNLAETMGRLPSTQLELAFANAQLASLPSDGFVLPASEVETWLDAVAINLVTNLGQS